MCLFVWSENIWAVRSNEALKMSESFCICVYVWNQTTLNCMYGFTNIVVKSVAERLQTLIHSMDIYPITEKKIYKMWETETWRHNRVSNQIAYFRFTWNFPCLYFLSNIHCADTILRACKYWVFWHKLLKQASIILGWIFLTCLLVLAMNETVYNVHRLDRISNRKQYHS